MQLFNIQRTVKKRYKRNRARKSEIEQEKASEIERNDKMERDMEKSKTIEKTNSYVESIREDITPLTLWYTSPAEQWAEAMPLGNGRMGIMVYGHPEYEKMDISEITCFSGAVPDKTTKESDKAFLLARQALLCGDYAASKKHIQAYNGERQNYGTNLPTGHLVLESCNKGKKISEYKRSLDLKTAVATVQYRMDTVRYQRTAFISNPHQVMVIRLTADTVADETVGTAAGTSKAGEIAATGGIGATGGTVATGGTGATGETDVTKGTPWFTMSLDGGNLPYSTKLDPNGDMLLTGQAYENMHSDGKTGVLFHARLRLVRQPDDREVLALLAVGTDFDGTDPFISCKMQIENAAALSYDALLTDHIQDYQKLFNRVSLSLGSPRQELGTGKPVPTDQMVIQVQQGESNEALTALMFQYGRYLLISSSRENSPLPAHLQGVWNDDVASRIGWTCDMHLDINTQMNYWPAEVTHLPECHKPLLNWIEKDLVPSGRKTARQFYGLTGWVAELVSNAWAYTAPYWHYNLSPCPTGGVWVATHLWEHYLYTGDRLFLEKQAYPVLKEAVEFFMAYVFEDPKTGFLTSGPSISPENLFLVDNQPYSASLGCTYEIVMIRELFDQFIKAGELLKRDLNLVRDVRTALDRLLPFAITDSGAIKEWAHEYPSTDAQHRHTSHLLSLYPFSQITPEKTPKLADAAKRCIDEKMTPEETWEDTGWARSMLMLYAARLKEQDKAYRHILAMQQHLTHANLMVKHPPTRGAQSFADVYELDGNTGLTTCIAEILLQSHDDCIQLLPALPEQWKDGSVAGLCARGGYVVDMTWQDGSLKKALIYSRFEGRCTVHYKAVEKVFDVEAGRTYGLDGQLNVTTQKAI